VNPADLASDLDFEKGHKRHQQDVTLAVALFLKDEISKEKDLAVLLTREKDQKIDLDEEVKMIEKNKPDFLIELHVNKGFGKKSSGFEIYCPDYTTAAASQKINANQLQLRNRSRSDSLRMARIVQDHFNQLFPRKSRGIRKANTPLNEKIIVPSLVVELGFISDDEDRKKLLSEKTQKEIARALAQSIQTYFR